MAPHFLRTYYIANYLLGASYFVARQYTVKHHDPRYSRLRSADELFQWERNLFALVATAVLYKLFKFRSVISFVNNVLNYSKMIMFVGLFMMDFRLLALWLLAMYVIFIIFPQPWYHGPSDFEILTGENFKDTVLKDETQHQWLVVFYTQWSADCIHLSADLAELSLKYTTPRLSFAYVDLGFWPRLAVQLGIDCSSTSTQLPTLILYQAGKPQVRMPLQKSANPMTRGTTFTKADIVRVFELAKRSKQ